MVIAKANQGMTARRALRETLEHPDRFTLRGLFVDSGAGGEGSSWRFTYRPAGAWRIEYNATVQDQLISDGERTWVVEEGVAVVVARRGESLVNSKLQNLVTDVAEGIITSSFRSEDATFQFTEPWDHVVIEEDEIDDRQVWVVELPRQWAVAIDQKTGVGLRWWNAHREISIRNLELDPCLPPNWFSWSGPEDAQRRPGVAYVGVPNEQYPDLFTAHWEVTLGDEFVYYEAGPGPAPVEVVLTWARERAREVIVRTADCTRYSAGERSPNDEPLPDWPG